MKKYNISTNFIQVIKNLFNKATSAVFLYFMTRILLWSSAVRVRDSQAYKKMDVTRERISRILDLREILLSFQTGFSLVNAAVAQVFEACDCLKLLSIHFDLCVDATGVVCHQLGLLGTSLRAVGCGVFVETLN